MLRTPAFPRAAVATAVLLVLLVGGGLVPAFADAAPLFRKKRIASVAQPTALAFTPAGDLYAASKGGVLHFVPASAIDLPSNANPDVALDLTAQICSDSERGLLGVAVYPATETSHWVFLYYTYRKDESTCVNRVSRYKADANGSLDSSSQEVLLDNIPSPKGNHNAGDLQFGRDRLLYVSIGDGGKDLISGKTGEGNRNARRLNLLLGKIVRITVDGDIPTGNPFRGAGSERCALTGSTSAGRRCQEIWATGLRNPFRMSFNEAGTKLFINDVGQHAWEEINQGRVGSDFGWNVCEGRFRLMSSVKCNNDKFRNPRFSYRHPATEGGISITGGAFVPNDPEWPSDLRGRYLFGDVSGGIRVARRGMTDLGPPLIQAKAPIHLVFDGPVLYYSDIREGAIFQVVPR